jgi:[acyl-carrier-protein] S-malonyltransferase
MLNPLIAAFPRTVNPLLDLLDATLPPSGSSPPLSYIISEGPNPDLTTTENAQPAILFTSIAILNVLQKDFGFSLPDEVQFFLGHSLGEFTALVAAGVLSLPDALRIVRRRGEEMRDCAQRASHPELDGGPGETGMVALVVESGRLPSVIKSVNEFIHSETLPNDEFMSIANVNSSTQIVLSGHLKAITTCICHIRKFTGHDPRALRLNVSAPFHSPVMGPVVPVVRSMLEACEVQYPPTSDAEVIANVIARPYDSEKELRQVLAEQTTATVRWAESIKYLDEERDVQRWIGMGPGRVGKNLVGREVRGGMKRVYGVEGSSAAEIEEVVKKLEQAEIS